MSVLYVSDLGYFISHNEFIRKMFTNVNTTDGECKSFEIVEDIFHIKHPYVKPKLKTLKRKNEELTNAAFKSEIEYVKNVYQLFCQDLKDNLLIAIEENGKTKNTEALVAAQLVYTNSGVYNIENIVGKNTNGATVISIQGTQYLFPKNCRFICSDVCNIKKHLHNEKFDVILLDPPWWNKYIRRKKLKTNNAYAMMYNDDLEKLPIEDLISEDGIVVIWCTNSISHMNYMQTKIFQKWKVNYLTKWYWMKVTMSGDPICNFSDPPGKQPFEQILFASRSNCRYNDLPEDKLIVSVPSALHSHKPPLDEILKKFIPENARCLEIFARYLLPNWTSYGLEAIRFQHQSLYKETIGNI